MKPSLLAFLLAACSHTIEGPAPTIDDGQEGTLCGDLDRPVTVLGTGISPMVVDGATDDARVQLPDVCLVLALDAAGNPVEDAEPVCLPEENIRWISQSEIEFTIGDAPVGPGVYDVIVRNPDGSEARGRFRLTILAQGPLVFWVDPPVVYSGISTQIVIYGAGLGSVASVVLVDDSGAETGLEFTPDPDHPNRVNAIVPSGLADGAYDVVIRDSVGCEAGLPDGISATGTTGLTVSAIDPPFAWTDSATPVTITGAGFLSVPRAYLNPVTPSADTVASTLRSVAWLADDRLTAVVPEGLPADRYTLIVVNPDGNVGLLEDAFLVTADPPPVVDHVSPDFLDNDSPKPVTITGANFRADPTVSMACRSPDGSETDLEAAVTDSTETSIEATLPVDSLSAGTVCVIRVTNTDGSYYDWSAISVSNPSSNLQPFEGAADLVTARRAPGVVAGRATRAARFVYAIGGDAGGAASAMDSVETAGVDIFGDLSPWFVQPVSLPAPRTLAGAAVVDRFLWLVGGSGPDGPTTDVWRAEVLDPLDAPRIEDVAARRGDAGEGIGAGVWYYRVSAVMADDDPSNPGGESLPSDPLSVNLPDALEGTLVLTLIWDPVPGAKGYRVYRSPGPDMPAGSELLLAEVPDAAATSYEDATGTPAGDSPRPLGATGVWMSMPSLGSAREAPGVAVAQDPDDHATFHLYVVGGRAGAELATGERLTVTVEDDGTQSVDAAWIALGDTLPVARAELALYSVSHLQTTAVPEGTTYLYAGGGDGSTEVDVALVLGGGDLEPWSGVDGMSPARSGYAAIAGADFLFAFGGQNGAASDGGVSSEISPPPDLVNWNNEGERLAVPRYLAGAAVESAFVYVVGGDDGDGPTAAVERTVL